MKFRCERDALVDALATAGRAVSTRGGALPVLSGVKLELSGDHLRVTGSDLDLTMTVDLEVGGKADGVAVLPSKLVSDIVRSLESGSVDVSIDDDDAQISSGRSEFSVRVIPAEGFPQLERVDVDGVTLDAQAVGEALKQVVLAASSDDSRPILTGVLVAAEQSGLRLVATDSYRLAVRDLPGTTVLAEGQTVLVPSRALNELTKLTSGAAEMSVQFGERDATFVVGSTRLTTRLIEGDFPNYRGLIPTSHPNTLTVDREALLDAVRRVRLLAQESTPVRLRMSADGLDLIAVTQDVGQAHESIDATYDGEELTVAFNPEFLLQGIEVTPGEELRLETVDALKPALLRTGEGEDFLYLLMPVRVS